jgi:hypothetical protein
VAGALSADPEGPRLAAGVVGSLGEWGEPAGSGEVQASTEKESTGEKRSNWGKKDNSHRGTRLVAFLVEWMGLEEMRSGAGVLDIAGGSGLLTFELVLLPVLSLPQLTWAPRSIHFTCSVDWTVCTESCSKWMNEE